MCRSTASQILPRALRTIAAAGYDVIGLDGDADDDIADLDLSAATALVLGAEGKGLRRLTRETCDRLARLGTSGPVASLNVSNAAAVALYACSAKMRSTLMAGRKPPVRQ